jgi:hypothetical protein
MSRAEALKRKPACDRDRVICPTVYTCQGRPACVDGTCAEA